MGVPAQLQRAVDDAVRQHLVAALDSHNLLLSAAASAEAAEATARAGRSLLDHLIPYLYPSTTAIRRVDRAHDHAVVVEYDDERAASNVELALAFGAVTANLLTPQALPPGRDGAASVELLCAAFNLGIGMIDGLCDGRPPVGRRLLEIVRTSDLVTGADTGWPPGRVQSVSRVLATDPTVAFIARVVEAFVALLHIVYPDARPLRREIGGQLEIALAAEQRSTDRPWNAEDAAHRSELLACSRQTSVVPFQIIERLATGVEQPLDPTPGTLLGEALWRIDDLVDLAADSNTGALNSLCLTAGAAIGPSGDPAHRSIASLEEILSSSAISVAAEAAAESLAAGLVATPRAAAADRANFLFFVQSYAGIPPRPAPLGLTSSVRLGHGPSSAPGSFPAGT